MAVKGLIEKLYFFGCENKTEYPDSHVAFIAF